MQEQHERINRHILLFSDQLQTPTTLPISERFSIASIMKLLWVEGGFGSEQFGRLHCVVTHANLQPAVAAYVCRPGDSTWRAMALDVLRIEDGLITEIVVLPPDTFPLFGLPILMHPAPEMNMRH